MCENMEYLTLDIRSRDVEEHETNTCFKKQVKTFYCEKFLNQFDTDDICSWVTLCRCLNCRVI